ncbi:hypothetical protein BGZ65_011060 [Modicella reniformis]|uniref:Secreted protein n=1 Tax=Modicella reniformis TaxID=1440133 RepID=A0A9P6JK69_9FUNG|nr:hypothetical protein BGZ65_011060 [Modicella reniformis]
MTKYSTTLLALFAIVFSVATFSVIAAPIGKAKPSEIPSFTVYQKDNLQGNSEQVTNYGCHPLTIGAVSSTKYGGGPVVGTMFYEGKDCTGNVIHKMDTSTVESMGGPFKSQSVMICKKNIMSYDKKFLPMSETRAQEQETFGNQAPYTPASYSGSYHEGDHSTLLQNPADGSSAPLPGKGFSTR